VIRLERTGAVARVTIDRPDSLNAVDFAAEAELEAIWRQLEADRDLRAIVLTGAGERAFSAGADMKQTGKSGLDYWAAPRPAGFGGIALRTTLDVPVIARVNGHALGGGFEMVLGCDLVVSAAHATVGLPEPRVGRLPLDGGMVLLQRQVAFRPAMAMLLTGRRIGAAEALGMGLVNEVVPTAELDTAVERWLDEILRCAPTSVRAIKQTVRRTAQLAAADAQALRLPAVMECLQSPEGEEGVRAFVEKRAPAWAAR
jgi:crotonobetainyl-CoA hydratase